MATITIEFQYLYSAVMTATITNAPMMDDWELENYAEKYARKKRAKLIGFDICAQLTAHGQRSE